MLLPWNRANRVDMAGIDPLGEIPFAYINNGSTMLVKLFLIEQETKAVTHSKQIKAGIKYNLIPAISIQPDLEVKVEIDVNPTLYDKGIVQFSRYIEVSDKKQFINITFIPFQDHPGIIELEYVVRLYYHGK